MDFYLALKFVLMSVPGNEDLQSIKDFMAWGHGGTMTVSLARAEYVSFLLLSWWILCA